MIGIKCDRCNRVLISCDIDFSTVTSAKVKELREETGAGMLECKEVLGMCGGNASLAKERLRKRGLAVARYIICQECGCHTSLNKKFELIE